MTLAYVWSHPPFCRGEGAARRRLERLNHSFVSNNMSPKHQMLQTIKINCKIARLTRLSFQKQPLRSVSLLFESICASFLYLILYFFFILIFLELFLCISQFGRSPGVCLINYVTPLLFMHQFKKPTV